MDEDGREWARQWGRLIGHCDDPTWDTVQRTLKRLPEEVREFALDWIQFTSPAEEGAHLLSPSDRWTVVLSEKEQDESVVAHEVAHAWRGHEETSDEREQEVRDLARAWGFTGFGASGG